LRGCGGTSCKKFPHKPRSLSKHNSLHTTDLLRALVNVEDNALCANGARSDREARGHQGAEAVNDSIGIGAENAVRGTAHTEVGNVARAVGKNLLVGGGNVRVRAEQNLDPSVEITTESKLFAGGFGVNVEQGDIIATVLAFKNAVDSIKGRGEWIEINSAADVDAKHSPTVHITDGVAHAGSVGGVVGGADDAMLVGIEIGINILHAKGVVAKRDEVNARIEERFGIGGRNAANFGGIFSVCNAKINFFFRAERPKLVRKIFDGNVSNNVAKGKNTHRCAFLFCWFCVLFFLKEFDLLAYGTDAKADASGVGGIGRNTDVGGLHCDEVACRADGLDAVVNVIHRECDVIESAADTVICAMQRSPSGREDFEHARAGVEHCAGMIVCIVPRANRFHTQQVTVKMHRIIKMFFVYAFEREVVKSVCFPFHKSLLLGASSRHSVIIVPHILRGVNRKGGNNGV